MKDLFLECARLLEDGEDVVMITIINRKGSAPRTAGSKMLVRRDGTIEGTIGGGLFEARAIDMAEEVFRSGQAMTREFKFLGKEVTEMDMICGGSAEIFVDLLRCSVPGNAAVCRAIAGHTRRDTGARLVTRIDTVPGGGDRLKLAFLDGEGNPAGMSLPVEDLKELDEASRGRFPVLVQVRESSYLVEPVHFPGTVVIFGAGHVSQKLSYLAAFLGFQTIIVDDRGEFANERRFPDANQIVVPGSMEDCMKDLQVGRNSFLVIVTRGHAFDAVVLAQALRTEAGYIGMIGSRKKREAVYRHLLRSGVREEDLARVHCPIGMDILAETPEEIAVSIAGELVQARARLADG